MDGIFSAIWLIIIIAAISGAKKKRGNGGGTQTPAKPVSPVRQRTEAVKNTAKKDVVKTPHNPFSDKTKLDRTPVTKVKDEHNHKFGSLSAVLEDRNNDWLAKQLREEAKHKNDLR